MIMRGLEDAKGLTWKSRLGARTSSSAASIGMAEEHCIEEFPQFAIADALGSWKYSVWGLSLTRRSRTQYRMSIEMGPVLFRAVAMTCATKLGIGVGCDTVNGPAVMRALSDWVVAQPDIRGKSSSAMNP